MGLAIWARADAACPASPDAATEASCGFKNSCLWGDGPRAAQGAVQGSEFTGQKKPAPERQESPGRSSSGERGVMDEGTGKMLGNKARPEGNNPILSARVLPRTRCNLAPPAGRGRIASPDAIRVMGYRSNGQDQSGVCPSLSPWRTGRGSALSSARYPVNNSIVSPRHAAEVGAAFHRQHDHLGADVHP
jgi:hypothetical protein